MKWRRETGEMAVPPGNRRGVGSEAYLNGTSQGSTSEDARKDGHIRGRSRQFMKYPGYRIGSQSGRNLPANKKATSKVTLVCLVPKIRLSGISITIQYYYNQISLVPKFYHVLQRRDFSCGEGIEGLACECMVKLHKCRKYARFSSPPVW